MALTKTRIGTSMDDRVYLVEWNNLDENDSDPEPVSVPHFTDVTIQVIGDFGVGGAVKVDLSLWKPDETPTYFKATDAQGNEIAFTAAGGETKVENAMSVRPIVTAGSGVDVDVRMLFTGPQKGF